MTKHDNRMASPSRIDLDTAVRVRDELEADLAGVFTRRESRAYAVAYLRGLASDLPRKNGWSLSEQAGHTRPDGLQRLLYKQKWDAAAVRDRVRAFAGRYLGTSDAVLVFDETGQEKSGTATAGVGRQYTGTAGKITNAVVAVYCTYASSRGHCLIDGDLYVQKHWFTDPQRYATAGFGADHTFRTKPTIAVEQAERVLNAGLGVQWGLPRMRSTAVTGSSGPSSNNGASATYSPWVSTSPRPPPAGRLARTTSPRAYPHTRGTGVAADKGPKAPASTTGP